MRINQNEILEKKFSDSRKPLFLKESLMEEGDLVLCKVKKVTNTITFVEMPNGQEGTIISSEIAAGRIKLMRQYVVPNKQIVCKILKIEGDHVHLSLRRVTSKEKKEVFQKHKQEQTTNVAFKQILKEKEEETKSNILETFESLHDFIIKARNDITLLIKHIPEEFHEAMEKIIHKKRKNEQIQQDIKIKCIEDDGVIRIKNILNIENENLSINYISAGKFKLILNTEDLKTGKKKMNEILEKIEKDSKKNNCEFFTESK